jgi:hypothetical protein
VKLHGELELHRLNFHQSLPDKISHAAGLFVPYLVVILPDYELNFMAKFILWWFHSENAILNLQKAVQLTGDGHPDQAMYHSNLGNSQETHFKRLGDLSDLKNAIYNQQMAVQLTDDGDPRKLGCLSNLGSSQST